MKKVFINNSYVKGKNLTFEVAVTPYERKILRKNGFVDFPKSDSPKWVHPNGTRIEKEEVVKFDFLLKDTKITGIKEIERQFQFYVPGDTSWRSRYFSTLKSAMKELAQ